MESTGYNIESFYATGGSKTIKYTFNVNIGDNFIFEFHHLIKLTII
jgi:hypothetical protein